MPKKDGAMDDNKKTTKDVVNKKQKQMLNQEETKVLFGEPKSHSEKVTKKLNRFSATFDSNKSPKFGLKVFGQEIPPKNIEVKGSLNPKTAIDRALEKYKKEEIDPAKIAEALGGYIVEETTDDKRKKAQNKAKKANQQKVTKVGRANVKGVSKLPSEAEFAQAAAIAKRDIESDKSDLGGAVEGDLKRSMRSAQRGQGGRRKLADTTKGGEVKIIRQANPSVPSKKPTPVNIKKGSIPEPKDAEFTTQVKKGVETQKGMIRGKTGKPEAYLGTATRTTSKERKRVEDEIKAAGRKFASTQSSDVSDIGQFRRQATRQKSFPLRQTKKGIEVGVKQGRPAKREKPKISYQDLKKQIDAKNPTYISPKSGGKLPLKRRSQGFKNPATADAARDAAIKKATRRVGRKASVKAGLTGGGRFLAKRIPGIGMAVAAGEAGARLASGDKKGAAIAGLEGMSSMIPGVGTAISTALGGYGLARDVKRAPETFKVADKVKGLARGKTSKQVASRKFAKAAMGQIKTTKFNPLKVLDEPIDPKVAGKGGRMMGAKTKLGVAVRAGGIGMGLDMARRAMFKAPKPKLDTGIVGKRSAGG